MEKSKIEKLLSGMCCSICGRDFDRDAFTIADKADNVIVLKIRCPECGKNFGTALLGEGEAGKDGGRLEFKPCPMPVSSDDVLDAHKFFDKLEKDWIKYIPDNLKKGF